MGDAVDHTPPLRLEGVSISVPDGDGRRVLLDAVDLQVEAGEVVAITGASGSGKSTLLAVAGLLRRADAGEVHVAGTPTATLDERRRTRLRRRHVAIVYQSANLLPTLTAVEQLQLVAHIGGRRGPGPRREAERLLAELDMGHRRDALPAHLSGGERQRVGIARALMARPSVLLADEPTASLDPEMAAQVAALLAAEARRHELATIIVTHDAAPLGHADRRLHLRAGELRAGAVELAG